MTRSSRVPDWMTSIRRWYPQVCFVIAIGLILLAAYYYQPQFSDGFSGFYLFLLSLPFIRLSFPLFRTTAPTSTTNPTGSSTIRRVWIGISVVCMGILTVTQNPEAWAQPIHETLGLVNTSIHVQMLLFVVGLGSLIYGFDVRLLPHRITWQMHHWLLLCILALALIVRLWNLEYAIHKFIDELLMIRGINAIELKSVKMLLPQANPFTDVFSYFQFIVNQIIRPSLTSLRIPTVIFGVLGVAGIYALARQLFSLRTALLSAFLLAFMPVYVHLSRVGINNIVGGVIATWAFVYVLRAMRSQRLSDFAITGVLLGLTHYFYEGDRIFFTLFFVLWMIWSALFLRHDPHFRLPNRKQWTVLILCLGVLIVPFYHALWSNNRPLTHRLNVTRDPEFLLRERLTDFLLDNEIGYIGSPIQRYVQYPIMDNFYQSDYAFVLPYLVPFFLLGFGILLFQIRRIRGSLFVWWMLGVAISNSFIFDGFSAASTRYVVVYMVLMVVVAVGMNTLWTVISLWVSLRWRRWVHIGLMVACIGIGLDHVSFYFTSNVPAFLHNVHTTEAPNGGRLLPADEDMILRAVELPSHTTVHVFTNGLFSNDLKYEVPYFYDRAHEIRIEHRFLSDLTPNYFRTLPHDRDHVFVFRPFYDSDLLPTIQRYFTITEAEGSPFDIPYEVEMYFYFAPAESR